MTLTARRLHAYGWLLLNTVVFGATIPIVKWGLGDTTPFRFLFYRFAIGLLLSIPLLFYFRDCLHKKGKLILQVIAIEFIGTTLTLGALYLGLARTTAIEASLIASTGPIFLTFGALIFLKEKVTSREWFGLSIAAVMTVVLTVLPSILSGQRVGFANLEGNAFVFLQNIFSMVYFLLVKRYYHKIPAVCFTCMSVGVGFVTFFALSFFQSGSVSAFSQAISQDLSHSSVWLIAIFAAVFTTFVGMTTFTKGQEMIEASEASLFAYLQPLVYIPLSLILLGEHIHPAQLLSFGAVLIGVLIAEWQPRKRSVKKRLKKIHKSSARVKFS